MSDDVLKLMFGLLISMFAGIRWLMQVNHKQAKENTTLKNELTTRSISDLRLLVDRLGRELNVFGEKLIAAAEKQKEFEAHLDRTVESVKIANEETVVNVQKFVAATEKKLKLFEGRLSEIVELGKDVFMIKGKPNKDKI